MLASRYARKLLRVKADVDFSRACALLEVNERIQKGEDVSAVQKDFSSIITNWQAAKFAAKISYANDFITTQLSEMFQHMHDMDSGDVPPPSSQPPLKALPPTAAHELSIGPSTATNPLMTLGFQMKALHAEKLEKSKAVVRDLLTQRHGFSLWLGPSQSASPSHPTGVYLRGHVPPGTVTALYPGAVFNPEMRQKAIDCGHLANPNVPRLLVKRFDDAVIDVFGATSESENCYAVAQYIRPPPPTISPNCMRIQYDFVDGDANNVGCLPFPEHLRPLVPNQWGSLVSAGQELFGLVEQSIYMKGCVVLTTRGVLDEELFVEANEGASLPLLPQHGFTLE